MTILKKKESVFKQSDRCPHFGHSTRVPCSLNADLCLTLTNIDTRGNSVDDEQSEAVVVRDKRRHQSSDEKIGAEDCQTIDTAQISDETNHDTNQRVGHADDKNKYSCLTGVKTGLDLAEVRQVDQWNDLRQTAEEVTHSKYDEIEVGQQTPAAEVPSARCCPSWLHRTFAVDKFLKHVEHYIHFIASYF